METNSFDPDNENQLIEKAIRELHQSTDRYFFIKYQSTTAVILKSRFYTFLFDSYILKTERSIENLLNVQPATKELILKQEHPLLKDIDTKAPNGIKLSLKGDKQIIVYVLSLTSFELLWELDILLNQKSITDSLHDIVTDYELDRLIEFSDIDSQGHHLTTLASL